MSRQSFFSIPKFNKKPIYSSPTNKYQEFSNAYHKNGRKLTEEIDDTIKQCMATPFNLYDIQTMRPKRSLSAEDPISAPSSIRSIESTLEI
ncbi:unnamed protein product [Rhizophagus irregularis]|nr:unnamed protein product [Rhizophagus irregularis]